MEGLAEARHQDLLLLSERRRWQEEVQEKRWQLEEDKRALQHLKSKALRERWLLDQDQDQDQDQTRTRSLEDSISRLEDELLRLEEGGEAPPTILPKQVAPAAEVKGHSERPVAAAAPSRKAQDDMSFSPSMAEVRGQHGVESGEHIKRAMYSVEIRVQRDRATGATKVLSSSTRLPVDLQTHGVKVYEDERKVVHEMNGEDGVQLLSSSEVEQLLQQANQASSRSPTGATPTSFPAEEVQEQQQEVQEVQEVQEEVKEVKEVHPGVQEVQEEHQLAEIKGLQLEVGGASGEVKASPTHPVTMVFMGFQNVEDEDQTRKVLGLQGTVKAQLVHIQDPETPTLADHREAEPLAAPAMAPPPSNGASAEWEEPKAAATAAAAAAKVKKDKQPCRCCSIM